MPFVDFDESCISSMLLLFGFLVDSFRYFKSTRNDVLFAVIAQSNA